MRSVPSQKSWSTQTDDMVNTGVFLCACVWGSVCDCVWVGGRMV